MRVLRYAVFGLIGLVVLLCVAVAGGYAWLQSSGGRSWLVATIEGAASGPGQGVDIEGLDGLLGFDMTVDRVTLTDGQGRWLTVEQARLSLSPFDLLRGRATIHEVAARRIVVERAPVTDPAAPEPEPQPGEGGALPSLPVSVALDRLAVDEVRLGEALAGQAALLRVGGSALVEAHGGPVQARLEVRRIDERPGRVALDAGFDPSTETLTVDLTAAEPAGGLVARLAALPGLPPVDLALKGQGPLSDWTATLVASAGTLARVTAEARLRDGAEGQHLTLDAGGDVVRLLDAMMGPQVAALVGPSPRVTLDLRHATDGTITVQPLNLTAAAARATLSGTVAATFDRVDLRYEVTADRESPLTAMAPGLGWRVATLTGTAAGPLTALKLAADAAVEQPALPDPGLAPLAGPRPTVAVRAEINARTGRIAIDSLDLAAAAATATLRGTVDGWGRSVDAAVRAAVADLSHFAALAGQPLAGSVELSGPLAMRPDGTVEATLDGGVKALATGTPADAILGAEPTLRAAFTMAPDGTIRVPVVRVDGRQMTLSATATLASGRLQARSSLELPDIGPVGEAVDTPMQGRLTVTVDAAGPLDALEVKADLAGQGLSAAGRDLGTTTLTATAAGLPAQPRGRIDGRSELAGGVSVAGAYALDGTTLRLSDLAVARGENRIGGAVQLALDRMLATGKLEGALPDLRALSDIAGTPLAGDGRFTVALSEQRGGQSATVSAAIGALRVGEAAAPALAARRLTVEAEVADALRAPAGKAKLDLRDGSASGQPLAAVTASIDGSIDRASFAANVDGGGSDAPMLDLAGGVTADGADHRIRLERLNARYQGETVRLAGPATITVGAGRTRIADLRLTSGTAKLSADAAIGDGRLNGAVKLEQVPLALARLADPALRLQGVLNGSASLSGTTRAPQAAVSLRVADLKAQETVRSGLPGIDATMNAQWRANRLAVDGSVATRGSDGGRLTLTAGLPLVMNPTTMVVAPPANGQLTASATGSINLALVNDLLAGSGDRARGTLRLDVKADGPLSAPRLGGTVTLTDGRYENRASGAVISNVSARIVGDGYVFTIQSFSGRTANGGTVQVGGTIRPATPQGPTFDLKVKADNARLVQTDIATANVGADLTLTGPLTAARLAGPIRIHRAEVQVPERVPSSVTVIDVVEVGKGRARPAQGRPDAPAAAPVAGPVIALDMTVDAPNRIFVRGRGLTAELGGQLKIAGTAAAPVVTGRFQMQKGNLDLIGNTFTFTRGIVDFDGTTPIDPRLDVVAEATTNGVTAQVLVGGTAKAPKLELASPQGVPQDEVLARVLFGKSLGSLGPAEAVQLAQSAAALAGIGGGGGGILDRARQTLGVDRLGYNQGENGKGGSVEAGRYLSDGVYVGVEQGVGTAQSRAKVEIDITKNIQAEADVGTNANPRVGVTVEWDY